MFVRIVQGSQKLHVCPHSIPAVYVRLFAMRMDEYH